jgi:hypothetical protein
MLYSQLSKISGVLSEIEIDNIDNYFSNLSPLGRKYISLSKIINICKLNPEKAIEAIRILISIGLLKQRYSIRCPECGLLLYSTDELERIPCDRIYCYQCDDDVEITVDDVEVIYELVITPCFFEGEQRNGTLIDLDVSSAVALPKEDTLRYHIQNGLVPNYLELIMKKSN